MSSWSYLYIHPQCCIVASVHVSPMLDEEPHHSCVATSRCIPHVHVSAVLEEDLHNVGMAVRRCPPQRHCMAADIHKACSSPGGDRGCGRESKKAVEGGAVGRWDPKVGMLPLSVVPAVTNCWTAGLR